MNYKENISLNEPIFFKYFLRPIAKYIYPYVPKAISGNMVSYFRFAIVTFFFFIMSLGNNLLFSLAIFIYILNCILDCLDGEISRQRNTATYYGKYIDGYLDVIIEIFLLVFGFIYLLLNYKINVFVSVIICTSLMLILMETYTREKLSFYREWIKGDSKASSSAFFKGKAPIFFGNLFIDIKIFYAFMLIMFISPFEYIVLLALTTIVVSLIRMFCDLRLVYLNLKINRISQYKK